MAKFRNRLIILFFFFFYPLFVPVNTILAYNPLEVQNNIYGMGIVNLSDLDDVFNLVNNNGDWGYVTVVITEDQRDINIWQDFFNQCRKKHLIPIIRIATKFENNTTNPKNGGYWKIPKIEEIDSWINFFNSLNWVIENKYVVIGNEPNHAKEWGGNLDPEGYARYLKEFSQRLKNSNNNYFVLNAGFDQAATNSRITMDQKRYMDRMLKEVPDLFDNLDGWASHSYPNPNFSGSEKATGRKSIRGYEWEMSVLKNYNVNKNLPIFITETGWIRNNKNEQIIAEKLRYAYESVWSKDKNVVAVTPFILNYQNAPFYEFSWKKDDNTYFLSYKYIKDLKKVDGKPLQKINGEIMFSFLNPFIFNKGVINGYTLVRNSGQNIWNKQNVTFTVSGKDFKLESIELKDIVPYSTGIILYSIKAPDYSGLFDLNIGFYVNEKQIGEVYKGKIIKYEY